VTTDFQITQSRMMCHLRFVEGNCILEKLKSSSMRLALRSKKNRIVKFQRSFRVALQGREVHNERIFDSEHRIVFKIWIFPIEDLSSDWLVTLTLHLLTLAGSQTRSI
jgi:hypothetical protein